MCILSIAPVAAAAGPVDDLAAAIGICFDADGNADQASLLAQAQGWATEPDPESGLLTFYPQGNDATFGFMALDGSFCQAESTTVASDIAAEQLLTISSDYDYLGDKSEMGCTVLDFDGFATASITSGGQDPVCASDDNSAIRFEFK